jgi:hypothetical protein
VAETESCNTGSNAVVVEWADKNKTKICTANSNINQPFPGPADSDFLYPSLWAAWEVTAAHGLWNRSQFMKNVDQLGLQVVFQFITSSTASSKSLQECFFTSQDYTKQYLWDVSPLLGQAWCSERNCNNCNTLSFSNATDGFCRCNVWDGKAEACAPSSGLSSVATSSFTITTSSKSQHGRSLNAVAQTRKKLAALVRDLISMNCTVPDAYSISVDVKKFVVDALSDRLTFSFKLQYDALVSSHSGEEIKKDFELCVYETMKKQSFEKSYSKLGSFCKVGIVDSKGNSIVSTCRLFRV